MYLSCMIMISIIAPNAMIVGWELFPESEELQFNELWVYFVFFGVSYRWRSDGSPIKNIKL